MNSLSGRVLLLTVAFVMIAEVLIFVPSIANFRQQFLLERLERGQLASLALLADPVIDGALEAELLRNAGVMNVVLRRQDRRLLVLASPIRSEITAVFDLRDASAIDLIRDALSRLVTPRAEMILLIGHPTEAGGDVIEVALNTTELRAAMVDYSIRILLLSLLISAFAAALLFFAVRYALVRPIRALVGSMHSYRQAPEDHTRIIQPSSTIRELREAEESLRVLETGLTQSLRQKDRLASLGAAVAKISHDLRNILSSAQLFADRLESIEDPLAQRMVPKLLGSIRRAVSLTESTLAFGRAEEPAPRPSRFRLADLLDDMFESEALSVDPAKVRFVADVPPEMTILADEEQLFRILSNLVRNAAQAIAVSSRSGVVSVAAEMRGETVALIVRDTGPGLPKKTLEHLFVAFRGSVRKGGSGLGLAIAAELVRGHGGKIALVDSNERGTTFEITLPQHGKSVRSLVKAMSA